MSGPFADFSDGDDDHHSRACQCGQSVGWWCVEGRSVLARQQQYHPKAQNISKTQVNVYDVVYGTLEMYLTLHHTHARSRKRLRLSERLALAPL